jgi:diguanylate cyclase (GGDEF)-like protein
MVMASWPAASGRGRRPLPPALVRRRVDDALRRAMRRAFRYSVPMLAVAISGDAVHVLLRFGAEGGRYAAIAAFAIGGSSVIAWIGSRPGRRPEWPALAILTLLYGVTVVNAQLLPQVAPIAAAYQALTLAGSALFLAWSPRWHAAWLCVAMSLSLVRLAVAAPDASGAGVSQLVVVAVAALVSAVGYPLAYFRMQRILVQRFELRRLHLVARRQDRAVEDLRGELTRTARTDTVTGIGNRRALDEAMLRLAGTRLAAVLLDLDHFKAFNDRNGHLAGDAALARVGGILRDAVRQDDHVFRYGGEEFLILLPGGDRDSAAALAERVRVAVQGDPQVGPWGLTVSAGVAVADRFRASNPLGLLRRADAALYRAKRAGRNQVVVDDHGGAMSAAVGA